MHSFHCRVGLFFPYFFHPKNLGKYVPVKMENVEEIIFYTVLMTNQLKPEIYFPAAILNNCNL